jgi:hypothetical protein
MSDITRVSANEMQTSVKTCHQNIFVLNIFAGDLSHNPFKCVFNLIVV